MRRVREGDLSESKVERILFKSVSVEVELIADEECHPAPCLRAEIHVLQPGAVVAFEENLGLRMNCERLLLDNRESILRTTRFESGQVEANSISNAYLLVTGIDSLKSGVHTISGALIVELVDTERSETRYRWSIGIQESFEFVESTGEEQ